MRVRQASATRYLAGSRQRGASTPKVLPHRLKHYPRGNKDLSNLRFYVVGCLKYCRRGSAMPEELSNKHSLRGRKT